MSSKNKPSKLGYLTEMFGGKWKYKGWRGWFCSDGRSVRSPSNTPLNNGPSFSFRQCYMYNGDTIDHPVYFLRVMDEQHRVNKESNANGNLPILPKSC